ncbi:MAG: tRNA pseudouridine(55) synthase TruB [Dehalococcoidia bacterium]
MDVSGILNVDKPDGWTSYRVVSFVRRGSGVAKVGHAGTLDPTATGVLLVCLGRAVRLSQYLMELPKTYRAEVALGTATDTYDAAGRPTFRSDASGVGEAEVEEALTAFVGKIQQTPPPHSAIKRQGRPAYAYARAGRSLSLAPRRVVIHHIDLLAYRPPLVSLSLQCGKGMYVRSLAHDLGQRLGCGAHLRSLTRLGVGPFTLEDAHSLRGLDQAFDQGYWQELLLPLDYGLGQLPAITLDSRAEEGVRHGSPLPVAALSGLERPPSGQRCRAYAQDGGFIAVLRFEATSGLWRPEKVFPRPQTGS